MVPGGKKGGAYGALKEVPRHHHVMVFCWTPLDQEADPGILNPGKGTRKIKTTMSQ